ncbi:YggT family protein [Enterococcus sp. AZ103]|uniref:YggT family protein n=1 Tax=Enterococcus alishanensis TaxID=1303817 RepID=A0ABS6TAA8_9ENTE|nr:YggT family protein [Enterococcus alishanensis]MBV7389822.1 YggT family protein [Enterococcus alishanensis]
MIIFLLTILIRLVEVYTILLVVYALMSWFPGAYNTGLGRFLSRICEPFLNLFRRLPLQFGGIDFSIMAAVIVLNFAVRIIVRIANQLLFY